MLFLLPMRCRRSPCVFPAHRNHAHGYTFRATAAVVLRECQMCDILQQEAGILISNPLADSLDFQGYSH